MDSYAEVDNALAEAQLAIGESSNLAQVCLTYTYNFEDRKYNDYACILSVLAQCAIDNAKRRSDVDLTPGGEISYIKKQMEVTKHKYPIFWRLIRKGFNERNINRSLRCPMNYLYSYKPEHTSLKGHGATLPMSHFLQKYPVEGSQRRSKKVEKMILKYSLRSFRNVDIDDSEDTRNLLLRSDFDKLIVDIRRTYLSRTYVGLFSWLIDRAFIISTGMKRNIKTSKTKLKKNRSLLLKVLYEVNSYNLLECLSKNMNSTE